MILKSAYVEVIVQYSIFIWTYFFSLSLSSYLQTWYASLLGDKTAARSGYGTFNPFPIIDWLGFLCLAAFGFGWHQDVPLDPTKIRGQFRDLRVLLLQLTMPIVHIGITLASLLLLSMLYPMPFHILLLTLAYGMHPQVKMLTGDFPNLNLILALLLSSMIYYNSIMVLLSSLRMVYKKVFEHIIQRSSIRSPYLDYALILGPLVMLFFITRPLINYVLAVDYKLFFQFAGLGDS